MTDEQITALVERLRSVDISWSETGEWCAEAADLIEAQAAENARLREALQNSNKQAEHFERKWYLCGDEVDRLREALGRIARLEGVGGPDAELQCADMASAALAQETQP